VIADLINEFIAVVASIFFKNEGFNKITVDSELK